MKQNVVIRFVLMFLLFAGLSYAADKQAAAQTDGGQDKPLIDEELFAVVDANTSVASTMSARKREIEVTVNSFSQLQLDVHRHEHWPAPIGPINYHLEGFVALGAAVDNINADVTGGGACVVDAGPIIRCTGTISTLTISYDYLINPTMTPPYILPRLGGSDSAVTDYTITLHYPASLLFAGATPLPDFHDAPTRTAVWTQNDATVFRPQVKLYSSALFGQWLPAAMK